mmetsp:Transcript_3970/g.11881  ORF Transcript_3970/g.11881 Transcript_3970/m.11881 type:complete len:289 (+) Transcript_3970:287-1153(+)
MVEPTRRKPPSSNSMTFVSVPLGTSIVWYVRRQGRPRRPLSTAKLSSLSVVQTHLALGSWYSITNHWLGSPRHSVVHRRTPTEASRLHSPTTDALPPTTPRRGESTTLRMRTHSHVPENKGERAGSGVGLSADSSASAASKRCCCAASNGSTPPRELAASERISALSDPRAAAPRPLGSVSPPRSRCVYGVSRRVLPSRTGKSVFSSTTYESSSPSRRALPSTSSPRSSSSGCSHSPVLACHATYPTGSATAKKVSSTAVYEMAPATPASLTSWSTLEGSSRACATKL